MTEENWIKNTQTETHRDEMAARLIGGQITLAQYAGLSKTELYTIAQQAYQLLDSGRLEEARDIYSGLVAADPFDSVFHCHLGATQMRLGQTDEAFDEFELALQYNIANIDAFVGRGEVFLQRGQLKEAIADMSKAIELDTEGKRRSTMRAKAALFTLKSELEKQQAQN